jgi:hypothetical protein
MDESAFPGEGERMELRGLKRIRDDQQLEQESKQALLRVYLMGGNARIQARKGAQRA